jgi:hypothetical protein
VLKTLAGKAAKASCVDLALFCFSHLALTLRFSSLKKILYAWEQREVEWLMGEGERRACSSSIV